MARGGRGAPAIVVAAALGALVAGCGRAEREREVTALQARRDLLAREWRPKAELWSEIEREGQAAKELRVLREERAALESSVEEAASAGAAEQIALEAARAAEAQARAEQRAVEGESARLDHERALREERLRAIDARRRAGPMR